MITHNVTNMPLLKTYLHEEEYNSDKTLFYLFLIYIIASYLQFSARKPFFEKIHFEFALGTILLIGSLIKIKKSFPKSGLVSSISSFVFLIFIMSIFSYDRESSFHVLFEVIKHCMFAWFIVTFVTTIQRMKLMVFTLLLAFLKITSEGFLGFITGSMMWANQGIMRLHGATPMWEHPNSLSSIAVRAFVLGLIFFPIFKQKLLKVSFFALVIMSSFCIIFSGSRGGYLAFIGFMLFYTFFYKKNKIKKIFPICAIVIFSFAYFIPQDYFTRFESIFTQEDIEGHSIDMRKQIIDDSIEIFYNHPFGVGIGAFPTVRLQQFDREQDTHNLILEIATNMGIQGCIVFFILIYKVFRLLFSVKKKYEDHLNRITLYDKKNNEFTSFKLNQFVDDLTFLNNVCVFIAFYLVVLLFQGLTGHNLYQIQWWLAIGTAIALFRIHSTLDLSMEDTISKHAT